QMTPNTFRGTLIAIFVLFIIFGVFQDPVTKSLNYGISSLELISSSSVTNDLNYKWKQPSKNTSLQQTSSITLDSKQKWIQPSKNTSKWIVVTSIQSPTEDVKRLASYPDWTLVVVGDEKTSDDWNLPDVHYLSLETQAAMGFGSVQRLPTKSYTRKNAGYLYAIANGAEWIYDTDDDNKPFGKGLEQFEYSMNSSRGLRFVADGETNSTIQDTLFNPYRHFGRPDIWPRGFPLEHIKNHDHRDGSYRLCHEHRPPAVQQGIVQKDPDVDAIYRLLHAEPTSGLDESFNQFAPPVILAPGTYAPWNSQNTLFSRSAFFGLFLPTTVAFRVTDIWRSYFTQALLHAAGETVGFVPVNAIQRRNAHSYLKDFNDEIEVYDKSGEIVKFIDKWKCHAQTLDRCTIELAEEFAARGFWGNKDAQLVVHWVLDLQQIGYVFPAMRNNARSDNSIGNDAELLRNCRRAHVSFHDDLSLNTPRESRAAAKINNFGDLKEWCADSPSVKSKEWYFPTPRELTISTMKNKTLTDNHNTVAIITNNYQWKMGMGLLQRMYEANFAMLIFCGHYPKQDRNAHLNNYPDNMDKGDVKFPKLKRPISYIDLSNEEVHEGYFAYYCLAKVEEMKLQNVNGYAMFSDDTVFNFWNPINLNIVQGAQIYNVSRYGLGYWWTTKEYGLNAVKRTIHLLREKYNNIPEVSSFVEKLKYEIGRERRFDTDNKEVSDPFQYLMVGDGWANGDWIYIPTSNISFAASFAQVAYEGRLFHELFTSKLLRILSREIKADTDPEQLMLLWREERSLWPQKYTEHLRGLHAVKLSAFQIAQSRAVFCDVILHKFYQNTFQIGN
ncbi:hypothetical protein PRIPAC_77786, partial [Pristionchus pacificus]